MYINDMPSRGHKDKIFEIRWDPINTDQLVTVGMKHIKFWTQTGGGFTSKRGIFGKEGKVETMLCASYSKTPGMVYSGASNGSVYVWENGVLKQTVEAHKGPVFSLHCLEKVVLEIFVNRFSIDFIDQIKPIRANAFEIC